MSGDLDLGKGVGRGALVGAALGVLVVGGLVTVGAQLLGLEPQESVGVGAVAAVWAGPGFGAMYGAIAAITRNERVQPAVERAEAGSTGRRPG